MVDEQDQDLPEDDDEDESTEEVEDSDETTEEQPDNTLALLEQRLAALEGQNTKIVRDFSAAAGRVQSLVDRLESGRGDTEKLRQQVSTAVSSVEQQLDAILSSDVVDPEIRARAQQARDRMRAEAEIASLKGDVEALKTRPVAPAQAPTSNELNPLEVNVHTMIQDAGLKIEDFDWNEAQAMLNARGEPGVYAYFTNKIAERKTEAAATERRQVRKNNAGKGSPQGSGPGGDVASKLEGFADSGDLDAGVALLRELGVNV